MNLSPGSRLAHYEIVSSIGAGGMGVVYRARDTLLGRDVALKVMAPHVASDPAMRSRFETEARAVASLSHPGILSIYELAVSAGVPFAAMELLEGENLRERVARGPLPWRQAVEIAASLADALGAAHAKGIVHRDLKPENVFLTTDGQVKILDFGLALQQPPSPADPDGPTLARTATGVVLGTFGYMSPEQVTGRPVDGRTDIFALGCLLFEMLTGRRMFSGATPQEQIAKLLQAPQPELTALEPGTPTELPRIVSMCVQRDPARRFSSAYDVAAVLRALISGSTAALQLPRSRRGRGKSIAVLPFSSTDPELDYLGDGITESIINTLSQLGAVRVVPRSLVFRYKGTSVDPAGAGMALNVRSILTGRISRHGETITVQAELVDTATESQLWGEQYRRTIADVVTLQEEIAWQISEALRLKLTPAQRSRIAKRPTVHPEAYQQYLRGRHQWNYWTADGFQRAREHFQKAIEIDPLYAPAYAGLGDAYGALAYYGYADTADGFARAHAAARRALELDGALSEAHVTVALAELFGSWRWRAAEEAIGKALALNPRLSVAHSVNALYLITCGRFDEALTAARTGRELDPLSFVANMAVAWVHHFAGHADTAAMEAARARELSLSVEEAGNVIIASCEMLGRFDEALRLIAQQRCWGLTLDADALRRGWQQGGTEGYWRTRLALMQAAPEAASPRVAFGFAIALVELGDPPGALAQLERLADARAGGVVFIPVDPVLRRLRGYDRYEALLRRVGSPLASQPAH